MVGSRVINTTNTPHTHETLYRPSPMRFAFWPPALIFVLLLMPMGTVFAQPVRLAVISDPTLANLTDALTAELSKDASLTVLERADLNKLGQEAALQAVVNSNDFTAVR